MLTRLGPCSARRSISSISRDRVFNDCRKRSITNDTRQFMSRAKNSTIGSTLQILSRSFRNLHCSQRSSSTYSPLFSSSLKQHVFRILELHPGQANEPVEATLKEASLLDNVSYEAISYCWGSPQDVGLIICNGQQLQVPRHLVNALKSMRHQVEPRTLWADAICINQADIAERESQVLLMRSIFSKAQKVLVWLGGDQEKREQRMSMFASATIKMGLSIFRRRIDQASSPQLSVRDNDGANPMMLAPFSTEVYLDLMGMLRMPWFQRAWVVQEIAVSSEAVILWGNHQYGWDDVTRVLRFMSQANFPLAFIVTLENIASIEEERRRYIEGGNNLRDVLLRHRRCLATDPRDKIYSFCGLVDNTSNASPPVRITYQEDVATTYRDVARQILDSSRTLDLLSQPTSFAKSDMKGLPSWAPDWSTRSTSKLTYAWGHNPRSLAGNRHDSATKAPTTTTTTPRFCASANSDYLPHPSLSPDILELRGHEIDQITEAGPIFQGVQIPGSVTSFKEIVREWSTCVRTLLHARKTFTAWQRIAGLLPTSSSFTFFPFSRSPQPDAKLREVFLQTVTASEIHSSANMETEMSLWDRGSSGLKGVLYSAYVFIRNLVSNKPFLLFEIQGRYALGRRIVKLGSGRIGLASGGVEMGDLVTVCEGGKVLLVFRRWEGDEKTRDAGGGVDERVGGHWTLVGDIYVHGLMHGEAFEKEKCRAMFVY